MVDLDEGLTRERRNPVELGDSGNRIEERGVLELGEEVCDIDAVGHASGVGSDSMCKELWMK